MPAGVASLSVDARLTIANMTTEWGALAGVFPTDDVLLSWLYDRGIDLTTYSIVVACGACSSVSCSMQQITLRCVGRAAYRRIAMARA